MESGLNNVLKPSSYRILSLSFKGIVQENLQICVTPGTGSSVLPSFLAEKHLADETADTANLVFGFTFWQNV